MKDLGREREKGQREGREKETSLNEVFRKNLFEVLPFEWTPLSTHTVIM